MVTASMFFFFIEHHAEIFILGRLFEFLEIGRAAVEIHVAEGHDVFGFGGIVEVCPALAASADGGYIELVVEGFEAQCLERRGAAETALRHGARQKASEKEVTSRYLHELAQHRVIRNSPRMSSVREGSGGKNGAPRVLSLELDGSHRAIQDRPGIGPGRHGGGVPRHRPQYRPSGGHQDDSAWRTCANAEEQKRLRERLFREARSAGMLSHPGIVTIYDVEQQGDLAYIAMEYVDGPTLDQVLSGAAADHAASRCSASWRRPPRRSITRTRKGIVHRDIKPANIMIAGRRHGQDRGFRHRQDHRLGAVHHDRLDRGHAALHVAGAGAGPGGGRAVATSFRWR